MLNRSLFSTVRLAAAAVAVCFAAAQIPLAAQTASDAAQTTKDNDAWLAQTAKLYYSSSKAGLKGFDCTLRPDWHALYSTSSAMSADDQQRVAALNQVGIVLHARMKGGSSMDWNPPEQLNSDQSKLLSDMHDAINQTIVDGFMQFWTPFIENSVVPDSSDGLEMSDAADGSKKIHLKQADIELNETFDSGRILRQYNIVMSGTRIELTPTYAPSPRGLIISHFHAFIHPADTTSPTQEMNVDLQYETIDGFPLPTHFVMEVTGVATLHIAMDGCSVQK
jgi:hypothetical protein